MMTRHVVAWAMGALLAGAAFAADPVTVDPSTLVDLELRLDMQTPPQTSRTGQFSMGTFVLSGTARNKSDTEIVLVLPGDTRPVTLRIAARATATVKSTLRPGFSQGTIRNLNNAKGTRFDIMLRLQKPGGAERALLTYAWPAISIEDQGADNWRPTTGRLERAVWLRFDDIMKLKPADPPTNRYDNAYAEWIDLLSLADDDKAIAEVQKILHRDWQYHRAVSSALARLTGCSIGMTATQDQRKDARGVQSDWQKKYDEFSRVLMAGGWKRQRGEWRCDTKTAVAPVKPMAGDAHPFRISAAGATCSVQPGATIADGSNIATRGGQGGKILRFEGNAVRGQVTLIVETRDPAVAGNVMLHIQILPAPDARGNEAVPGPLIEMTQPIEIQDWDSGAVLARIFTNTLYPSAIAKVRLCQPPDGREAAPRSRRGGPAGDAAHPTWLSNEVVVPLRLVK